MKIVLPKHSKEGSVLIITVVTLFVLTIAAVSYLSMLQNGNRFVARDQAWNRALVIAEAGVEEAMAHINSGGEMLNPLPNFGGDGWSASGNGYLMTRSTGLYGGGYSVVISGPTNMPTITSTGMVTAPLTGTTLTRVVQVTAPFTSGFQLGIAAITSVTMNGNNIYTDSYDSANTNLFPGGLYNVANRQDHGDVASLNTNFFSIGNANIMGTVHMPAAGVESDVQILKNGSVGSVAWVSAGSTGFEGAPDSPYFLNDFNSTFPDVQVPYTSGASISQPGTGATNTVSSGIYYYNGNYSIPNTGVLDISPYSYVELYVTGTFNMNGQSLINIETGATLVLYVGGSSATFTYINNGGNANNFEYWGLPANTQITLGGNGTFVGRIYAPEAGITLNGSGSTPFDYQGAMLVNTLTSNGHFNMHYDENLARATNSGTYVAFSWTELTH